MTVPRSRLVPSAPSASDRLQELAGRLSPTSWIVVGVAGLIGVLLIVLTILAVLGGEPEAREPERLPAVIEDPTPTPVAETPTPTCPTTADLIAIIEQLRRQGQYDSAFESAKAALTLPCLSPGDRQTLAGLAVASGLDAVIAQYAQPANVMLQQRQVDRFRTLERLAVEYSVPLPRSYRQISGDAYGNASFLLAAVALEEAFSRGEVSATDQPTVRYATSVYYNLGFHYTEAGPTAASWQEGLRALVTSCQIDRLYVVGDGLACARLEQLLGKDDRRRPEPLESALLQ